MNLIINSRCRNNYLYDKYIKDANLYKGLKGAFELDLDSSIRLIRLLKYAPKEWNIEDKETCREKLATYKRDLLIANSIIEKLRGNEYDEDLYDYATKIDIGKVIEYKLDFERFNNRCTYYLNSSVEDRQKLIDSYEYRYDIDVETEAILYLVKKSLDDKTKVKVK